MFEKRHLLSMKKTLFYNFFPSKAEEEIYNINNTAHEVTRELVEIRNRYPSSRIDLKNPWQIKKKIIHEDIVLGFRMISFFEILGQILDN